MGRHPFAEIDVILAFRHVGPFPEWAAHHPHHKDVILCLACFEEWCPAMSDPTFDDRVIADGVAYLDTDGQEVDEFTDRYVEALTRQELLTLGTPKRCAACHTSWERVEGITVVLR
jgi:hypothetical protein